MNSLTPCFTPPNSTFFPWRPSLSSKSSLPSNGAFWLQKLATLMNKPLSLSNSISSKLHLAQALPFDLSTSPLLLSTMIFWILRKLQGLRFRRKG